jgi:hypothetical protein
VGVEVEIGSMSALRVLEQTMVQGNLGSHREVAIQLGQVFTGFRVMNR